MSRESVLVVPAESLAPYEKWFDKGLLTDYRSIRKFEHEILNSGQYTRYMDREEAETNPRFKQLIPYCVLYRTCEGAAPQYYSYRRTKKGGEGRLHGKYSLGIGGHINPCDTEDNTGWYIRGLARELFEETGLLWKSAESFNHISGLLYDDSNDVGKVHLGVVHLIELSADMQPVQKDPAITDTGFWLARDLKPLRDDGVFENWSNIVFDQIISK